MVAGMRTAGPIVAEAEADGEGEADADADGIAEADGLVAGDGTVDGWSDEFELQPASTRASAATGTRAEVR